MFLARAIGAAGRVRLTLLTAAVALIVAVLVTTLSGSGHPGLPVPGIGRPARSQDPFAYIPSRAADFEQRAIAGTAYVLFTKSPGGVLATAARVAQFRPLIDRAAAGSGIDPGVLEGMVFLESAGRPDVIAGTDPADASGLTQILAETGQALLGMHIDLAQSRKLTREADVAFAAGRADRAMAFERRRAQIDDRFDPAKALAATVRYLRIAEQHFGRLDLAVESYHMGIGNLQQVLGAYDGGHPVPYVQLFFDTAPDHAGAAYQLLAGFGDDSWLYYWRVRAAEQIMSQYRSDPSTLRSLASLELATTAGDEVLHPLDRTRSFADPSALYSAYADHQLVPLPSNPAQLHLRYDSSIGSLGHRLGVPARLYGGLRPVALALLVELAARVHALWHGPAPLILGAAVMDNRYRQLAGEGDPEAATGYWFSIERRYASEAQAVAFQAMLDRLQALNLIDWVRTPTTIDVTVASDAGSAITNGP